MCSVSTAPLDKLAQLRKPEIEAPIGGSVLEKRARAKVISTALAVRLANLDSPLKKSYWNTYHCARLIQQQGKSLTTKYCKNRWCMVCNRIRTAVLIRGYEKALSSLTDAQFVTLTFPNVKGEDLRESIKKMYTNFNQLKNRLRKRGISLKGIRKLECTYNQTTGTYNPHYHLIVEGKQNADALIEEWLLQYPQASRKAQFVEKTNEGTMMELMKYFTKILPSKKTRNGKVSMEVKSLDTIFQAMQKVRVFQPMGICKHVSEEIEELEKKEYDVVERELSVWMWEQDCADWVNIIDFESLTGYSPEGVTMRFLEIVNGGEVSTGPI